MTSGFNLCPSRRISWGSVRGPVWSRNASQHVAPPVAAPPDQQAQVVALSCALEGMTHPAKRRAPKCQLVGPKGESTPLPESVFYVLERVAEVMARGDSITVVPVGREMTTQQAADLLNVSRQYLVRLLDEGRIPFRKTGKHRRLRIEDVLLFKETRDKDRRAGLRELSRIRSPERYQSEVTQCSCSPSSDLAPDGGDEKLRWSRTFDTVKGTAQERKRRGNMDRRRITNCAPVASGAGNRNEPFSNLFCSVCSPSSSAKYSSSVSRRAFTNKKQVLASASTRKTSRQNAPSFFTPHRTLIG